MPPFRPMKTIDNLVLAAFVLFAALSMAFSGCRGVGAETVIAQDRERLEPHIVLARMCSHEASLPVWSVDEESGVGQWTLHRDHDVAWGDDCFLIHQVILRGAERMLETSPRSSWQARYVAFAIAYSHDRFLAPGPHDGNAWAMDLHPDGHQPARWHGVPWGHARAAWEYVWALTGGIVRMTLDDFGGETSLWTCSEPVSDWGGNMDSAHARSVGLIEVVCDGTTVNTPYVRPGLR